MEFVSNVNGTLQHYKTSLRRIVKDYIITLNSEECDMQCVIEKRMCYFKNSSDIFKTVSQALLVA